MKSAVRLRLGLAALFLVPPIVNGCDCGTEPDTPLPAKITAFDVTPLTIAAGGTVSITWRTEDATSITITATPGGIIVDNSTNQNGTMPATVNENTVFAIAAKGADGKTATAMKTVTVTAPDAVEIVNFSANPMTVVANGASTLSWEVRNATSLKIDEVNGANLVPAGDTFAGTFVVHPAVNTSYVLTAVGAAGMMMRTVSVTVEGAPVITAFTAMPASIELGEVSTLSWNVTGANGVLIRNAAGDEVYNGADLAGTQEVTPENTETYTLTARSALGQEVTQNVSVTVNRAARIDSFAANPSTIDYGDAAVLQWSVTRARSIEVHVGADTITTSTVVALGSYTVTPTTSTEYTLIALNDDGDATGRVTVSVNPAAPRIPRFEATPNPALIGATSTLNWQTIGATQVTIADNANNPLYDGSDAAGSIEVTVTGTIASYVLTAQNQYGSTTFTVLLVGQDLPQISLFTLMPWTYTTPSTPLTINWDSTGTATRLELDGIADPNFPGTPSGTYTTTVTHSTDVTLHADNAVGTTQNTLRILQLAAELEPNNTATTALPITGDGAAGEITAGDVDFYSITVPELGNVYAEVTDGQAGCAFDTLLQLYGSDGTTVLGSDDDDGFNACSLIDPLRDGFATNLPAGTYYLAVSGLGATDAGAYALSVRIQSPACGNFILERGNTEQCDDGNVIPLDGCDAACQVEPVGTMTGPGMNNTSLGEQVQGRSDYYQITMLAAGYIEAEVFLPEPGRCDNVAGGNSTDVVLDLVDDQINLLGSDDDDGLGQCSRIDPVFDSFAAVSAGTYFIRVREDGDNAALGPYTLVVRMIGQGCPNGIIEGTEECDDGNTAGGDGCSQVCAFEGVRDVEPNNTYQTASPIASFPAIALGSISPVADQDWFSVTVATAGSHIDAYLTVNSFDSCPTNPTGALALYGTNGTTQLASNTSGGPDGNCGRVWPYTDADARGLAAGTYYLRVTESGNDSEIARYFLHVNVLPPGCGNTILEGTESCDDGNLNNGDGCSSTCTFDPTVTVSLPSLGTTTVTASIDPSYLRNSVRLEVTTESYFYAETFAPEASALLCTGIDTVMRLFAADGTTQLGTNDDGGIDNCSLIDPFVESYARLLPGTYYLSVEEYQQNNPIARYQLLVAGVPTDICGNGVLEPTLGERCDDGNANSGDGCDSSCQIEPRGTVVGPPGTMIFSEAINFAGEQDYYRLDVTAPALIYAETHGPVLGACPSIDTVLTLFDSNYDFLTSDNNTGVDNCSLINGVTTAAARVEAGTYFLRVEENGNNATIPAYQVEIRITPQNLCGNGVAESANSETCDDGNLVSGDGCAANCQLEPDATYDLSPGVTASFTGAIDPGSDVDVIQINVLSTIYLRAETFTPAAPNCGDDTVITLINASGVVGTDDDDGTSTCSLITRGNDSFARLVAGTYFLVIEEYNRDNVIPAYEVQLSATAADICGDGLVETAGGESCDDGNITPGDGCDAACQFEIAATYSLPGATTTFSGSLPANGSLQTVQIDLTAASYLRVELNALAWPDCANGVDPFMRLFSATRTQLATDDADGRNSCSYFNPEVDTFARLQAGTYFVSVEEDGRNAIVGNYTMRIQARQVDVCGNSYIEAARGEQCDDFNTTNGDGCSSTCQIESTIAEVEPNDSIATPQATGLSGLGTRIISGNISATGDADYYAFEVPPGPPLMLRARTFSTAGNTLSCTSALDSRLILYDAAAPMTEVGNNDDAAGTVCSWLDGTQPDVAPNVRLLPPASYVLRVGHYSNSGSGTYFLQIQLVDPN